jgi:HD-GYP domain-containing protein (c-di-GMP phosphodiesterase class II)
MSTPSPAVAAPVELASDELILHTRAERTHRLSRVPAAAVSASLYALVAAVAAIALPHPSFSVSGALLLVLAYAISCRVEFEFANGWAVPAQLVLVPMWFVLPPGLLPLAVAIGFLLGHAPELVRRRMPLDRTLLLLASSWYVVGPAAVLLAAGDRAPVLAHWWIYACALGAQIAVNFASAAPLTYVSFGLRLPRQLRMMAPAFAVDAALAPLGLVLAFPATRHPAAVLAALPLVGLLAVFARERAGRIDNAVELSSAYRGTAFLLGDVIEADDAYTGSHSRDVVELVLEVADRMGLGPDERRDAEFVALLHDVGKVRIPGEIINKPGPLDDAEQAIMRTHTIEGERMLEQVGGLLGRVGRLVRSCHERWDGGGYPDGLAGEQIPLVARIVCCCDAFSAMTTDRSYMRALPLSAAVEELRRCSGTHFDPRVVEALVDTLG